MTEPYQYIMESSSRITPFLWFKDDLKTVLEYYTSIFKDSKVISRKQLSEEGAISGATFELNGQRFHAMQTTDAPVFNDAVSLYICCEDQKEVDYYWDAISAEGKEIQCGWVQDKYGIRWQVIPKRWEELMQDEQRGAPRARDESNDVHEEIYRC